MLKKESKTINYYFLKLNQYPLDFLDLKLKKRGAFHKYYFIELVY